MFLLEDKVYGHPINKDPLFVLLGFPCVSAGKESTSNAEDLGLIPGLGRSPGEGKGNYSSILAWRDPWTENPDGLWSIGLQRVRHD